MCKTTETHKKIAESLSIEYRTKLALAREEAGLGEAAIYLRNLNRIENQRRLYQNIRIMEKKHKGGSTSKVIITSKDGSTEEYTSKLPMEKVIASSNEKQWHQTEGGSQLLQDEFIEKLGNHGEGPEIHKVMDGSFIYPNSTSTATKEFLSACKVNKGVEKINTSHGIRSRYKYVQASWSKRRESTSTHGLHVGHYKAAMTHTFLGWLIFQRGDIPAITGYASIRH